MAAQSSSKIGIFRLDLDTFPALKTDFGSVRLRVTGMPTSFSQIIVTRQPGDQFYAVTSRCTHQGSTINPYSATFDGLRCPNHGSVFAPDGSVIQGPASRPLDSYNVTFDGLNTLAIQIPGLGFSATIAAVARPPAGGPRVRLEFPTVTGVRYEIRFRPSFGDAAWTVVPFSTTLDGSATQTVFNGTNSKATVFVDTPPLLGFYAVVRF